MRAAIILSPTCSDIGVILSGEERMSLGGAFKNGQWGSLGRGYRPSKGYDKNLQRNFCTGFGMQVEVF